MPDLIVIPTGRPDILLRQLAPEDARPLFDLIDQNRGHLNQHGDDTAWKYPDYDSVLRSITNNPDSEKLRFGVWQNDALLGSGNLTPNPLASYGYLGYWIGHQYTRQGIATAIARALVLYAFEAMYWTEVVAKVHRDNDGSKKVVRRNGFDLIRTEGDDILVFQLRRPPNGGPS